MGINLSIPAKSVQEFITLAKVKTGRFSSTGLRRQRFR